MTPLAAPVAHASGSAPGASPVRKLYVARALGILALWITGAAPAVFGLARCPSALLLHRACPGCGTTRAIHLLAHGDVAASLVKHPLAAPPAHTTALIAIATVWATL